MIPLNEYNVYLLLFSFTFVNRILDLIFLHFPEKSVFGSQEFEESLISLMSLHPRNLAFFRMIICKQIFPVVKNHETK